MTSIRSEITRRALVRALAASPLTVAVTACGSLLPAQGPPPSLYQIQAKPEFPANMPKVDWQLVVSVPVASASLDTTRIALLHNPIRIEYYAQSNWGERAPLMLQSSIIEAFEASGAILSVSRDMSDARADYILNCELRDFQAEYFLGPEPQIHAGILAKLISARRRAVVATQRFDGGATAQADRIEDIIGAFSAATSKILGALVPWTLNAGEADRKAA